MSTNMELITSVTVGSGGAASVTLPATGTIAATYTDLKVVASIRTEGTGSPYLYLRFNGSSTGYSNRRIIGDGSAISSSSPGDAYIIGGICNTTDQTTNTFSSHDIYIPNYAGSNNKSVSVDAVTENNATSARAMMLASLWANSAAITSIVLTNEAAVDFAEGSTFYLYGISNVTSTTKATGGIVSSDGTYNYHMFPFSGTFTPTEAISADVLVVAGGGAGATRYGGGGGAGGLCYKSASSLTTTPYTITVGAGGAGVAIYTVPSNSGSNSSIAGSGFTTITANGGGYGGTATNDSTGNAASGGSGGGGGGYWAPNINGGSSNQTGSGGSTGYGNAGGNGVTNYSSAGGGGGAGAVGGNGLTTGGGGGGGTSGSGGAGLSSSTLPVLANFGYTTGTGVNVNGIHYYAGGGGGGGRSDATTTIPGAGGSGGGGAGSTDSTTGGNGLANTGGGGGGAWNGTTGSGGSGVVIIRYAI